MTLSLIRKATAVAAAVAILASGTVAAAQTSTWRLRAGLQHTWTAQVFAGVPVRVVVDGDGDSRADLDLYIYDQNGRLVAVDNDYTDFCIGSWTPSFTGTVTIRVVNVGTVYNDYVLTMTGGYFR
jgi:hypothetical protein